MVPLFVLILIAAVLCGIGITCEPQPPSLPGQRVEVNIAAAPIFPAGILGPKRRACGVA
jgi:hypothetical protein